MGNLNFRTTQDELTALFSAAGEIVDVYLPSDRETGRPRGFAFVQFANDDQANLAIERFNGHELGGRPLKVNLAEDRPRRTGPPFGGGGGGYRPMSPPPAGGGGFDYFNAESFAPSGEGGGEERDARGFGGRPAGKPKGSRRGLRARKRSL